MDKAQVIIKTKISHVQGAGDFTSSLALGRELRKQDKGVFFLINGDRRASSIIKDNGFQAKNVHAVDEVEMFLSGKTFDISILNQLDTGMEELGLFKKHSRKLVTIEDSGRPSLLADLRFNILYPRSGSITDFEFMPLSEIFQSKHEMVKKINKKVSNVLVMQGGSDTHGFMPKILRSLNGFEPSIKMNIVLGPYFSHTKELNAAMRGSCREFNITSKCDDLSDFMMQADIAISAAGNTLFELACLGVPTIVVCGEKFEKITARRLEKERFCINLGFGTDVTEEDILSTLIKLINDRNLRLAMSKKGKELVDGAGIKRIASRIIGLTARV